MKKGMLIVFSFMAVVAAALFATQLPEISIKHGQFIYTGSLFEKPMSLQNAFVHWDVEHYLKIAEFGYESNSESVAFFPLWPWIISLFFVGNKVSLFGVLCWQFVMWVSAFLLIEKINLNPNSKFPSLAWVTLLFPANIFYVAPYPEITFVVLVSCVLYSIKYTHKSLLFLSLCLLVWIKHISIIAAPALMLPLFLSDKGKPLRWAAILGLVLGVGSVLTFFKIQTGDPLIWAYAQSKWGRSLATPVHFLLDLRGKPLDWGIYALFALFAYFWSLNQILGNYLKKNKTRLSPEKLSSLFFAVAVLTPVVWGTSTQSIYRIVMISFPALACLQLIVPKNSKYKIGFYMIWFLLTFSNIYKFSSGLHLP